MLKVKNVTKRYGEKVAIENICLDVKDGNIFGFIGHNGAGKTTLIKSIVGIHGFDEGDILIDNISIKDHPVLCKERIAYIPDNPDIYLSLKGIEYLNFICDIYGIDEKEREERITKYAKLFEIYDVLGNLISSYSHGMKQKLVVIGALVHKPKLLVLDEPFVGLDPKSTHILKELMKDLCNKEGITIFFSSHVLEVVEKLCDNIAIIKNGKIVACGSINDIKGNKSLENVFLELTDEK